MTQEEIDKFTKWVVPVMTRLYLERELARWESVGLGWAFLRSLP